MSPAHTRPHFGLSVRDLEASVAFYRSLFGIEPSKLRPGYAKFELRQPALNLTLNEIPGMQQTLAPATHFGIELPNPAAVQAAQRRVAGAGLSIDARQAETCCYAVQDKFWAVDPDGHRWEHFTVTDADAERYASDAQPGLGPEAPASCCAPTCCGGPGASE